MTTQRFRVNMTNHSGLTVQSVNLDYSMTVMYFLYCSELLSCYSIDQKDFKQSSVMS